MAKKKVTLPSGTVGQPVKVQIPGSKKPRKMDVQITKIHRGSVELPIQIVRAQPKDLTLTRASLPKDFTVTRSGQTRPTAKRNVKKHKTVEIKVSNGAKALIDVLMVPVVRWLNSIDGVGTLYSCEGYEADENDGHHPHPYVKFTCASMSALKDIFSRVHSTVRRANWSPGQTGFSYGKGEVDLHDGVLVLSIVFSSKQVLRRFVAEQLGKGSK